MRYQQTFLFPLEESARQGLPGQAPGSASSQRQAGLRKTEPTALAAGLKTPVEVEGRLAASAVGSPQGPHARLDALRQQLRRMEARGHRSEAAEPVVFSAGGSVLDALLPHGGLRPGTLVEWVCDARQSGAMLLAMIAAAEVLAHPASAARPLVIADGLGTDAGAAQEAFYPPAAVALGIPTERMVIFRKQSGHTRGDLLWAIDQALRSGAVAAVFAEIGDWLDPADARRLQLAAEIGGAIGLLVRPTRAAAITGRATATDGLTPAAKTRASFADIRWLVSPLPGHGARRLQIQLARCRGGLAGGSRLIEIDARPDLPPRGPAVRGRVVAVRGPGANDATAAVASGLVDRLADSASAERRGDRRRPAGRRQAG